MELEEKNLIVFGAGSGTEGYVSLLEQESNIKVAGFTVDRHYLTSDICMGRPVVPFEEVESNFMPNEHCMYIQVGFFSDHLADDSVCNSLRENRFKSARRMGYSFFKYVSPHSRVGEGFKLRDNTIIHDSKIHAFVEIGENTTIGESNIHHHSKIGSHTILTAGVLLGGNVIIGDNCFIGFGAIILDGITVANNTIIGAGSVVTRDIHKSGVYLGSPAKRLTDKSIHDVI